MRRQRLGSSNWLHDVQPGGTGPTRLKVMVPDSRAAATGEIVAEGRGRAALERQRSGPTAIVCWPAGVGVLNIPPVVS